MIVGVITARANSKGLPGKNMIDLGGIPLIEHTFRQVINAGAFDKIILSTDLDEAIELAKQKYPEIEVPFKRPDELALDTTSHAEVIEHLIQYLEVNKYPLSHVVFLQPTTPFKRGYELAKGVEMLRDGAHSVLGVSKVMHHPAEYLYKGNDGHIRYVMDEFKGRRRQEYPDIYFDNGGFYGFSVEYFRKTGHFFGEDSELLEMGEWSLIDIDTKFELDLAKGVLAVNPDVNYV